MGCIGSKSDGTRAANPATGAKENLKPPAPKNEKSVPSGVLKEDTGRNLDEYDIRKKLGEGGFGVVYEAYDKKNKNLVALKKLPKSKILNDKDKIAVWNEIRVMQVLGGHPHVVEIRDYFEDAENVYVALELCSGGDMFNSLIKQGRYSEADAAKRCRVMLEAIKYFNENGVVHRDLKPENFLFDETGEVLKATDFGLATFYKQGNKLDLPCGTPLYIAPEVLRKFYDEKCDIWSTGVITYVMLSGRLPFHGKTLQKILDATLAGKYDMDHPAWEAISESAKDIVNKMLTYDPYFRPTAAELLEHPWLAPNGASTSPLVQSVFENLKTFTEMNKLKKRAIQMMATNLPVADIEKVKKAFERADEDNSGLLSLAEMRKVLDRLELDIDEEELQRIWSAYDVDENGEIDYEEFLAATTDLSRIRTLENIKMAFAKLDRNGDGKISVDEVMTALEDMNITEEAAKQMIAESDKNNDGEIDYAEFIAMMTEDFDLADGAKAGIGGIAAVIADSEA
uniref:Calmodulin n=4 Tax=Rhodosorus marinus TaxID=101924 RepID=A0A7S2ZV04_9RHOD|mmetsp:Transcript_32632/g.128084  ORF Transcript_32632/g.128084 Transcript_32632/m.128084 type:complete len:511 (+) Transcript_32632:116-1648(+)